MANPRAWQGLALGLVVGAAAGALLAWRPIPQAVDATLQDEAVERAERDDATPRAATSLAPAPSERADVRREPPQPEGETNGLWTADGCPPLLHEGLIGHARAGIARGWHAVRDDDIPAGEMEEGLRSFEEVLLESPEGIGRELARRRTEKEEALRDARAGGLFALLEGLGEGRAGPVVELVEDRGEFGALFERQAPERAVDGIARMGVAGEELEDGTTLSFPAGVFRLRRLMHNPSEYPRDVTVAGAGMDATLLLMGSLSTKDRLENFTLKDCTVHTEGKALFDLSREPAQVQLERVRLVGFDSGAGGSNLLETEELALWARDCEVLGGYGRFPRAAYLIDADSDGVVARFEGCRFERVDLNLQDVDRGATVVFDACTLLDLLADPAALAASRPGVVFGRGCVLTLFPGERDEAPQLDLNELFPDWRARIRE